ncbi:MAG TPA: DHA2 family efflux MFS transporter permease subunit [Candidatus Limnocylindrales bacterium]|nr:DHA2 family efflux MFS transporter permease subunit [Candidatus Limnocylindrales bacterium]
MSDAGPRISPLPDGPSRPRSGPLVDAAMLGLASGAILVPLNSTMLAVALPSIMAEFGVTAATVASLVTVYLGAVAIALPTSGSLGDRFGHRPMFLVGVVAFGLASTLAATAASFEVLALSRVLQAASGALVSTSSVSLLRMIAPADRRGAAFGLFDMLVSTSAAIGPLIGGLLVGGLGWRAMFLVAVPIAAIAAVVVATLPTMRAPEQRLPPRPIDLPGLALLAATLIALLAGIQGLENGGTTTLGLVVAPVLLVVFVAVELRTKHPAVDPRLFASPAFTAATLGIFGATIVLHATFVFVPLLVERLQGGDPLTSGLVLLGISALGAVAAPIGGRMSDAVGRRQPAVIGMVLAAAALVGLWAVAPESTPVVLGGLLAIVGFGMGMAGSPRQTAALETVEPGRVGMAAGTYYTGRYIGGAIGATLAGAILGGAVTGVAISTGFALLAVVAGLVAAVSMLLPGRAIRQPIAATG